jgi:hypothetical protein
VPTVSFTATISSTASDFDEESYKANVAEMVGLSDTDAVSLTITEVRRRALASALGSGYPTFHDLAKTKIDAEKAADGKERLGLLAEDAAPARATDRKLQSSSIEVTATITATSQTLATFIETQVQEAIDSDGLSAALGVTVTSAAAPVVSYTVIYPPPPSPPDLASIVTNTTGSAQTAEDDDSDSAAVLVVAIVIAIVGVIALVVSGALVHRYIKGKSTSTIVKAVPVEAAATSATSTSPPAGAGIEMEQGAPEASEESKI